ncbi:MAG: right-handed parallel beta-helix repeat-containing protein [Opitutales bacterium]|nr:right-handed parallel beta-helix repeat-containing protein [Opitutales bacterium]
MKSFLEYCPDDKRENPAHVTAALQQALDAAAAESGDRTVLVPAGRWTVRTFFLRSGVTLFLSEGAVLQPDPDLREYPNLGQGHNKDRQPFHLLVADGVEGVTITGGGTIDGCGELFWEGFMPPPNDYFHKAKKQRISPLLEFRNCRNLRLEKITICNSPGWTVHTFLCEQVWIDGVTIRNNMHGPNTDGLDINGCRHVTVSNCDIRGCDDNIIIKATVDAGPSEHIVVTNCILESLCAAVGLGAETASDIRHVAVSNCTVLNALRMLQIILWDGGVVENCVFTNFTGQAMTRRGTDRAIHIDIQEHEKEAPELGRVRNILISNFVCRTRGRILLTAQDGAVLENITLRDVVLDYPEVEDPSYTVPRDTSNQLSNFSPEARVARAAVVADNVKGLTLANIVTQWPADAEKIAAPMEPYWLRRVEQFHLDSPFLTGCSPAE